LVLSINTRESCRKLAFYAVKGSKTQDLPSSDVLCIWHGKTYARSLDGQVTKKEMKMRIVSRKPIKDKRIPFQKKTFKERRSPEDEAWPSEDIENQSIEVNMPTTSSKKEEHENFQVLTN